MTYDDINPQRRHFLGAATLTVAGPDAMAGRHRLREILHARGFPLL